MATFKDTKKVIDLASAKLFAAAAGTIAIATLKADGDLLALVDSDTLALLLDSRAGHEWGLVGTDYIYRHSPSFAGTNLYDVIIVASAAVNANLLNVTFDTTLVVTTDITGFSATVNAANASIASGLSAAAVMGLTLATPVTAGQTVLVSYDGTGSLTDINGRAVRPFTDLVVTNTTP